MRRRRSAEDYQTHIRYPLVDQGFEPGREFCQQLLSCGDFQKSAFSVFGKSSKTKEDNASFVAQRIVSEELEPDEVMLNFCRQPRMWLSFRTGTTSRARMRQTLPAIKFLTQFGPLNGAWYGPFPDNVKGVDYYAYSQGLRHYVHAGEDDEPVRLQVRWHAVVELSDNYVAIHWNNFTHNDDSSRATRATQFAYWRYVPKLFESMEAELGADWRVPDLHRIVLHTLRAQYGHSNQYRWTHKRVRAEKDGVALNAHSGAVEEIDVSGLEALTNALAKAALRAAMLPSSHASRADVNEAMLRTLIERWGTKSYEFIIKREADKSKVFRAHCFFGAKPDDGGQDSFPHLLASHAFGGSSSALEFLLPYASP